MERDALALRCPAVSSSVLVLNKRRCIGCIGCLQIVGKGEEIANDDVRCVLCFTLAEHFPDVAAIMCVETVINRDLFTDSNVPPCIDRIGGADRIGHTWMIDVASWGRQDLIGIGCQFAEMLVLPWREFRQGSAINDAPMESQDEILATKSTGRENAQAFITCVSNDNGFVRPSLHLRATRLLPVCLVSVRVLINRQVGAAGIVAE